jgi:uncharacterized YigZ family protein
VLFSNSFHTVARSGISQFRDRGSKFLGFVYPVKKETEIKEHLEQLKREHPGAVHCCYAWRLGADRYASRSNDDGEPAGSAGKPIMGQIHSFDLTNVLIVVVRYFGGTLLGVPGLIDAYKSSAMAAVKDAGVVEKHILSEYKVTFANEDTGAIMRTLKDLNSQIISSSYDEKQSIVFRVRKADGDKLEERMKGIYKAKLLFLHITD